MSRGFVQGDFVLIPEILEILELIDYVDEGYVEEKFPEIYNFGPERLGIHFEDKLVLEEHTSEFPRN